MKKRKKTPLILGAQVEEDGIYVSYAGKAKEQVFLLLYPQGKEETFQTYEMEEDSLMPGFFSLFLSSEQVKGFSFYNFMVNNQVIPDPHGKAFVGREIWGEKKDIAKHQVKTKLYIDDFNWEEDRFPSLPNEDVIAYSLHVRGFTMHPMSKVKKKGSFQGVIEKIPYLLDLGVNQIHFMPVYEFDENGFKCNYWGYGDGYFYAPKSSYSSDGDGVKGLKTLVKEFHKNNMEVILYFPLSTNISLMERLDILWYYRTEFHVDGFILQENILSKRDVESDPVLRNIKLYWQNEYFKNTMRSFLKGDEGMIREAMNMIRWQSYKDQTFQTLASHNGFTMKDMVSYDGKHNEGNGEGNQDGTDFNYSWNCGAEGPSRKKAVRLLRENQLKNGFLLLLLSQGIPCILSGDEFGNSQNGNNNAYCQDNEIGWVDWSRERKEKNLYDFVKILIQFRKNHKIFHQKENLMGMDKTATGIPDISFHGESAWREPSDRADRQFGVLYSGGKQEGSFFVAYNMHWIPHTFALPTLPGGKKWKKVIGKDKIDITGEVLKEEEELYQKSVVLDSRSIEVYMEC